MTVSIASITFDSADPEPLAGWWAERFGAEITANMDGFFLIVAGGSLPTQLAFQKVEDPTPGKNKLHLDVHTDDDVDAEVARWPTPAPPASGNGMPATSSGSPLLIPTATSFASPEADRDRHISAGGSTARSRPWSENHADTAHATRPEPPGPGC